MRLSRTNRVIGADAQSDGEFVSDLRLDPDAARHALAIRRAIARFRGIERSFVRSDQSFDDLSMGVADSIDELDFILKLEQELGIAFHTIDLQRIRSPDGTSHLTIAQFVSDILVVMNDMHCYSCGYSLRGNVSGICPECGAPV